MAQVTVKNSRIVAVLALLLLVSVVTPLLFFALSSHPAPAAYATTAADNGTPTASSTLTIYDNAVAPQFVDASFGFSSKNPCDTALYYSPPCSYAIAYTAWGGLNFQVASGSLNTAAYTRLKYKLNPNGQPISDFAAVLVKASGSVLKLIPLSSRNTTKLANGWTQVSLSLQNLNPSGASVAAIQLKSAVNKSLASVHFDDILLTGYKTGASPFSTPAAVTTTPPAQPNATPTPGAVVAYHRPALLPGQKIWKGDVSSFLFGSNDSEEWSPDNVQTDPHGIIQASMKRAHFTLERTFIFHYSLADGHRTSIGTHPQIKLNRHNPHEYDRPLPPTGINTGSGYEVEKRIKTIERMGMTCLAVLPDIWTTPSYPADPNPFHKQMIDPDTGKPETDLDFARRVVAYLGNRCNLYEIGNEPDLDQYTQNGLTIHHMDVKTYVERWTEFVRALKKINPRAKFIGPVTYNAQGNDCTYASGTPFPTSRSGDCYLQGFLHGVRGTHVQPDAVSFHWYPCSGATPDNCGAAQWNSYATVTNQVRSWVRQDLGHLVPVGITEWNFDPGSNTKMGSDPQFMDQFSRGALASMIAAKLDFAAQFDTQSFSGYGSLDMFDVKNGDLAKVQFSAVKEVIARYRGKG